MRALIGICGEVFGRQDCAEKKEKKKRDDCLYPELISSDF